MEKKPRYNTNFSIEFGKITFYTEILSFFTRFTREKRPQNNFSQQNFSVENNYFQILWKSRCHILVTFPSHLKKLRSKLRLF